LIGKDIYWYGVQAISLIEKGTLHSQDISPVFYLVSVIFKIFGKSENSLLIFQIFTAIWLFISIFFSRILIFKNCKKAVYFIPTIALLIIAFLYPKQSWALGFLIICIGFYHITNKKARLLGMSISFLLSFWFHMMVGFFGIGIWILFKLPKKYYQFLFIFFFLLTIIIPKSPDSRFYNSNEWFTIRIAYGIAGLGILWEWFLLVLSKRENGQEEGTLNFTGFLMIIPIFHFADIQYRILLSLILIVQIYIHFGKLQIIFWIIGCSLWIYSFYSEPNLFRYSYEQMLFPGEKISKISNNGLLIAHHGFCEYYHFNFGKECLSWKPDEKALSELPIGTKIYRAIYGIRYENLKISLDGNKNPTFSYILPLGEYQLVLEDEWEQYLKSLEKRESKNLLIAKSWKNPYRQRPNFLKRKHLYGF
jgi:hypothetical protein